MKNSSTRTRAVWPAALLGACLTVGPVVAASRESQNRSLGDVLLDSARDLPAGGLDQGPLGRCAARHRRAVELRHLGRGRQPHGLGAEAPGLR